MTFINPRAQFTLLTDWNAEETQVYYGEAVPGTPTSAASWRIKRMVFGTNGNLTTTWADGNDSFDNIWDNRASLDYS